MLHRGRVRRLSSRTAFAEAAERLWAPFNRGITGPALASYRFPEVVREAVPILEGSKWCGKPLETYRDAEDFFIGLLCGFDITHLSEDCIHVHHCRRFLGWAPTEQRFDIPLSFTGEMANDNVSLRNIIFTPRLAPSLTQNGCPAPVVACVESDAAWRMLCELRRAGVKPQMITHQALLSASVAAPKWAQALGVV